MKISFIVFVCVTILTPYFRQGTALECYECNTFTDKECEGNSTNLEKFKKHCEPKDEFVVCRKIVQEIEDINDALTERRVIRKCGWINSTHSDKCYHRSGYGGRQEVCSCLEDLCNQSRSNIASILLLISSIFMLTVAEFPLQF